MSLNSKDVSGCEFFSEWYWRTCSFKGNNLVYVMGAIIGALFGLIITCCCCCCCRFFTKREQHTEIIYQQLPLEHMQY
jgi:hypothetical protein